MNTCVTDIDHCRQVAVKIKMDLETNNETSHYVVTAHPPGSVLAATKCNFLGPDSKVCERIRSQCALTRNLGCNRCQIETSGDPSASWLD